MYDSFSLATDLKAGREVVRAVFDERFAYKSYGRRNSVVDENVAASIIRPLAEARVVNIEKFISDLS